MLKIKISKNTSKNHETWPQRRCIPNIVDLIQIVYALAGTENYFGRKKEEDEKHFLESKLAIFDQS